MLKEHLSQAHDMASRRSAKIDKHVAWIHEQLLSGRPARVLDLGCGPGLYASRLAGRGHTCVGIDYSPASIAYARETAAAGQLACTYVEGDLRRVEYGAGYDLAMQVFGEFNVFRPADIAAILRKARRALVAGGILLLEVHTFDVVRRMGEAAPSWYSSAGGVFSAQPHVVLQESFWDSAAHAATLRYFVIDAATGMVTPYAQSLQAYDDAGYRAVLGECGFGEVRCVPSLLGIPDPSQPHLFAIIAS
jgi:SAM-dependent methyltransferase